MSTPSRARDRAARQGLLALAPYLRRWASATVLHLPPALLAELEGDASLVRTGISAARTYGWDELLSGQPWVLDAYLPLAALQALQQQVGASEACGEARPVLLRAIDAFWPFPVHAQFAPQPLAALDLLEYPDAAARHRGRQVLASSPPSRLL